MGSGADYHFPNDRAYYFCMERARDLERNDTVLSQGLGRLVSAILLGGFTVRPNTGDDVLDRDLQEWFSGWCGERDEVTTQEDFEWSDVESMGLYQTLVDGDLPFLFTDSGRLEPCEAHRLRSPRTSRNVVRGVELDKDRRQLALWITKDDVNPLSSSSSLRVSDMQQIPLRDANGNRQAVLLRDPRRFSQTRGVSILQPIMDVVAMVDDVQFARLVQQQVVSAWCILREQQPSDPSLTANRLGQEANATENQNFALPDTLGGTLDVIAAGMEVKGEVGEKITGFSPNVPNPTYFNQIRSLLEIVAVNMHLPVSMLLLDPSDTNFSGWRGATDAAKITWRRIQKWYSSRFHKEVYKWKVRTWIEGDAALSAASERSGVDVLRHTWNLPRWPYIEPLKDTAAELMADRNALTSKRRLHGKNGVEWDELAQEIVADNGKAIRLAKDEASSINDQYDDGSPVHWREILSLPTPDGVQVNLSPGDDVETNTTGDRNVSDGN